MSTFLEFSNHDDLNFFPAFKPPITVSCWPGSDPKKVGPISNKHMSLNPLSRFLLKYVIRFEKIEFLKTFKSELIGFIISIEFFWSLNKLFTLESVKDHVITSKYPFDAIDLCKKWNSLCIFVNVGLLRIFSGLMFLILSYP